MLPPAGVLGHASTMTGSAALDLVTATLALAMATPTASRPGTGGLADGGAPGGECRLLGPFALLVQATLGALALLVLVFKRWRERPQRPLKIWFFDASKQVFGSGLVHVANIFMSMLTSGRFSIKLSPRTTELASRIVHQIVHMHDGDVYQPNPCSLYFINLAIDTTLGIPILIGLVRILTGLAGYTSWGKPAESIQSGYYGTHPRAWWWLKQSVIYFCGLMGMKLVVLAIFLLMPWLSRVGDMALSWTEGNEQLQIVFVMMLFPLIMNGLQYYIIDSYIQRRAIVRDPDPDHDAGNNDDGNGGSSGSGTGQSGADVGREPGCRNHRSRGASPAAAVDRDEDESATGRNIGDLDDRSDDDDSLKLLSASPSGSPGPRLSADTDRDGNAKGDDGPGADDVARQLSPELYPKV